MIDVLFLNNLRNNTDPHKIKTIYLFTLFGNTLIEHFKRHWYDALCIAWLYFFRISIIAKSLGVIIGAERINMHTDIFVKKWRKQDSISNKYKLQNLIRQQYYLNSIIFSGTSVSLGYQSILSKMLLIKAFIESYFFYVARNIIYIYVFYYFYFLYLIYLFWYYLLLNSYQTKLCQKLVKSTMKVSSIVIPREVMIPTVYCMIFYYLSKTTELTISSIILIFCAVQLYKQIMAYGFLFRWKMISLLFMIGSLAVNIAFCVWNTTYQLYTIESYLNNLYFLTIVGYVCRMYIVKNGYETIQWVRYGFIASICIMGLFYTAILIDAVINQQNIAMVDNSCQQVWYLVVNVVCLFLCIIALVVLYINQTEQLKKIEKYSFTDDKVNNPLFLLWVWIGINTLAQFIDLIETGLFLNTTKDQMCMVIPDSNIQNNILMFVFAILTMMSGYVATLWYYYTNRKKIEEMHSSIVGNERQKSAKFSSYQSQIREVYGLQLLDSVSEALNL